MTDGERMIWAVAFVRKLEDGRPAAEIHVPFDEPDRERIIVDRWKSLLQCAAESAYHAVSSAHESCRGLRENYGAEIVPECSDLADPRRVSLGRLAPTQTSDNGKESTVATPTVIPSVDVGHGQFKH